MLEGAFVLRTIPPDITLPEETGETFAENAQDKAEAVFAALGGRTAVMADDSGLEVAALAGAPGVRSARYAGTGATDEANVKKLLTALTAHTDRRARFVCALYLVLPPGPKRTSGELQVFAVEGQSEGTIAPAPRGHDGFGYDPVFEPLGWRETLAEADPLKKDSVSHRGAATRALLAHLREAGVIRSGP
jgi:XTP/dITP diphosphohydrolase